MRRGGHSQACEPRGDARQAQPQRRRHADARSGPGQTDKRLENQEKDDESNVQEPWDSEKFTAVSRTSVGRAIILATAS